MKSFECDRLSASGQIDQTLTFPPKSTPLARKSDCAVMGPKEAAYLVLFGSTIQVNFGIERTRQEDIAQGGWING